ncbi:Uncharacterised protein [Mycobacteroides abscessus subsp. massiliense]|nr:Uncharacterised protein [Mycobacteroides abscessus subsp. massiliense]
MVPSGFTIDCPVSSWNGALTIVNGDANTGDCHFELNCNGPTSRFTTGFVDGHVDPAGAVGVAAAVGAEAVGAEAVGAASVLVVADVAVVGDSGSDSAAVLATVGFAVVVAVGWIRPEGRIDPGFWESAVTTAMVLAT